MKPSANDAQLPRQEDQEPDHSQSGGAHHKQTPRHGPSHDQARHVTTPQRSIAKVSDAAEALVERSEQAKGPDLPAEPLAETSVATLGDLFKVPGSNKATVVETRVCCFTT